MCFVIVLASKARDSFHERSFDGGSASCTSARIFKRALSQRELLVPDSFREMGESSEARNAARISPYLVNIQALRASSK